MKKQNTFGAEAEKVIVNITDQSSHKISQNFFKRLFNEAKNRKANPHNHFSDIEDKTVLGVTSNDIGEQGLDNAFNLLETSSIVTHSLKELNEILTLDLKLTQKFLEKEGASIINMSIYPLLKRTQANYKKYVAPKGLYEYLAYRGWNHSAGIDARAQNSPATGIDFEDAADGFSVILGASAAIIALFANSPYEEGKLSGFKESRVTMWDKMMKGSKVKGDLLMTKFPTKRIRSLAEYFNWMFSGKTGVHFVLDESSNSQGYKGIGDRILILKDNPSLLDFYDKGTWQASYLKDLQKNSKSAKSISVKANISQMEVLQFAQFSGARIRFKIKNYKGFPLEKFVKACKEESGEVEKIFKDFAEYTYIEGRDPGANFPDYETLKAGQDIAETTYISPSALQKGLLNNLKNSTDYIDSFNWQELIELRDQSIKNGLDGKTKNIKVKDFTNKILELAKNGLTKEGQNYLAYPNWVLKTGKNGADRAIEFVEKSGLTLDKALKELIKFRQVKI